MLPGNRSYPGTPAARDAGSDEVSALMQAGNAAEVSSLSSVTVPLRNQAQRVIAAVQGQVRGQSANRSRSPATSCGLSPKEANAVSDIWSSREATSARSRPSRPALDHPRGSPPARFAGTPADQGNASYCGFQAYLGCTPLRHLPDGGLGHRGREGPVRGGAVAGGP